MQQHMCSAGTIDSAAFNRLQRSLALAMLIGLLAFVDAFSFGDGRFAELWLNWDLVWMGSALVAQPLLLAIWIAMGRQPLSVRLPRALGVGALLGLAQAWGSRCYREEAAFGLIESVALEVVPIILLAGIVAMFRRRYGWDIGLRSVPSPTVPCSQFSLRQFLAWTAGVAVILALARLISPEGIDGSGAFRDPGALLAILIILVPALLALPVAIPCIGLMLAENGFRRWSLRSVAMTTVMAAALFVAVFLLYYFHEGPVGSKELVDIAKMSTADTLSTGIGLSVTLLSVLTVVRLCGYRLQIQSTTASALQAEADPRPVARSRAGQKAGGAAESCVRPRRRLRFLALMTALGLAAAAMTWPARAIHFARRQADADRDLAKQFQQWGVDAVVRGGQVLDVYSRANLPIPVGVLKKLSDLGEAVKIEYLHCSPLADDDMQFLAGLARLKSLYLVAPQLTDDGLADLQGLTRLQQLGLCNTRVTDRGVEILRSFPELKALSLDGAAISDAALSQVASFKELRTLSLRNTQITDLGLAELRAMPNLTSIALDATRVTDAGLVYLAAIKSLATVTLHGTPVTAKGVAEFRQKMPKCQVGWSPNAQMNPPGE